MTGRNSVCTSEIGADFWRGLEYNILTLFYGVRNKRCQNLFRVKRKLYYDTSRVQLK